MKAHESIIESHPPQRINFLKILSSNMQPPPPPLRPVSATTSQKNQKGVFTSSSSTSPPMPRSNKSTDALPAQETLDNNADVKPEISSLPLTRVNTDTLPNSGVIKPSLTRRATGNSVTFASTLRPSTSATLAADMQTSAPPSSIPVVSSSASSLLTSLQPLTLGRVISSQFEDEATTHILAALEAEDIEKDNHSRLAGEGIDGMEDYSDDDDDENKHDGRDSSWARGRTYSSDSFIKNLKKHDNLQQYQNSPLYSGHQPGQPSQSSVRSSSEINDEKLAMLLHDRTEGSDGQFIDAVNKDSGRSSSAPSSDHGVDMDASSRRRLGVERQLSDIKEENETEEVDHRGCQPDKHDLLMRTEATRNMSFMAQRLHQLQRKSSAGNLSSRTSFTKSSITDAARDKSSEDKLLDALSSVALSEGQGLKKIRWEYKNLIAPKLPEIRKKISQLLFFVTLPCLAVASLLFYILDNPMAGNTGTSVSWWILFIGVRQTLIFEFARVGELFWVEIAALRSKLFTNTFGPYVALTVIQSKGWPYIFIFWPVLNFCFLYGSNPMAKHWLFWQNFLAIFNDNNPVDGVTDSDIYLRILSMLIFVGGVMSLKRLTVAIYLGRRTVGHFGQDLEKVMAKMILIGEVANLSKDIESNEMYYGPMMPDTYDDEKLLRFRNIIMMEENGNAESPRMSSVAKSLNGGTPNNAPVDSSESRPRNRAVSIESEKSSLHQSASAKLVHLLEEWEEPELTATSNSKASVQDLLNFRRAAAFMNDKYPFGRSFGLANTRELTVEAAQKVYERLMLNVEEPDLPFSVLSVLAIDEEGHLIDTKTKSLIRLFRPDREGKLSKLDFVKSIDTIYKELRLLRASIANSAQIDIAFEKIVNTFFYFFLFIIAVSILGIKIWTGLLSINSLILGASFLFGSAASKYFEGLLLIFVRRPYDIGDKIATSSPQTDTSPTGSSTWFVDRVTLYTTTVRFATTNEVATYSNGSLAQLRIINANRSPKAMISVVMKFGLETPFQRITIFRTAVENFIKARPREWISLIGFRATRVEADAGFIEYKILGQHRERWQNIGPILQSKADLSSFCLEVSKKLDMRYASPPMPVNLSASHDVMNGIFGNSELENIRALDAADIDNTRSISADDLEDVANLFEIRQN